MVILTPPVFRRLVVNLLYISDGASLGVDYLVVEGGFFGSAPGEVFLGWLMEESESAFFLSFFCILLFCTCKSFILIAIEVFR